MIHESAIIEAGATIGPHTRVWHHCHVRAGAVIGDRCSLGKNVFVDDGVSIGDGVRIQNNVSIYRGVSLASNVFIGPSAVFTNDRLPRAISSRWQVIPTDVQEGASIGANATIVCGVTLGAWCMVGAGAVVTKSVESQQLVYGVPGRPVGWVCRCGNVIARCDDDSLAKPPILLCVECQS